MHCTSMHSTSSAPVQIKPPQWRSKQTTANKHTSRRPATTDRANKMPRCTTPSLNPTACAVCLNPEHASLTLLLLRGDSNHFRCALYVILYCV